MKFIICQFGLTAVLWDAETEKFVLSLSGLGQPVIT